MLRTAVKKVLRLRSPFGTETRPVQDAGAANDRTDGLKPIRIDLPGPGHRHHPARLSRNGSFPGSVAARSRGNDKSQPLPTFILVSQSARRSALWRHARIAANGLGIDKRGATSSRQTPK